MSTPSFDRSASRAIRAYPPRFRRSREAELLDLVRDLADPAATRVGWRVRLDLLRGGLAFRLRDRPPLWPRLGYRLLDRRLPRRWLEWTRDDIDSRSFPARKSVPFLVFIVLLNTFVGPGTVDSHTTLAIVSGATAGAALALLIIGRRTRRMARVRHGLLHEVADDHTTTFVRIREVPVRQQSWPAWLVVGLTWLLLSPALATVVATTPTSRSYLGRRLTTDTVPELPGLAWPVFAGSLIAGLALLALVARRSQRRLSDREVESRPVNNPMTRRELLRVFCASALVTVVAALAAWWVLEPAALELASVGVGALLGPTVVCAGVVAARIERRSQVVVTSGELLRAALGRSPMLAPQPRGGLHFAPGSPPQ